MKTYYNILDRDIVLQSGILMPAKKIIDNKITYIDREIPDNILQLIRKNKDIFYIIEKKDGDLTISFENYNNPIKNKKKNKLNS